MVYTKNQWPNFQKWCWVLLVYGPFKYNGSPSQFPVNRAFWITKCYISQPLLYFYIHEVLTYSEAPLQLMVKVLSHLTTMIKNTPSIRRTESTTEKPKTNVCIL